MKMNKEEVELKTVCTLCKEVIKSHCNVILSSICHTANMLRFLLRVSSVPNGGVSEPAVNKKLFKLSPPKKIIHRMDLNNNNYLILTLAMQILLIAVFPATACHFNHFHIHLPCMTHAPYFSPIRSNIYTKTFYVAVHLFNNISKMMSKCGKS